jgi:hypothetical protein
MSSTHVLGAHCKTATGANGRYDATGVCKETMGGTQMDSTPETLPPTQQ